jgi:enoyl-CoA hydratase
MKNPSENFRIETGNAVAVVRFDRPDVRNALTDEVLTELVEVLTGFDRDPAVRAVVFSGSERVFVSGADIRALRQKSALDIYTGERARNWAALRGLSTPLVAAVSGHCLGGGLELAMYADISVASEKAKFGLPETQLGLIP